jgi:hypothetical protein
MIPAKPAAHRHDRGIIGRAFVAAIVAVIVAGAVAIVLAVRLVVFLVVTVEILQREAIVDGDVIDAGARPTTVVIEVSDEPVMRVLTSPISPASPDQKRRSVLRYLSFHSDHCEGNAPT